jgi:hypothetical protein
MARKSRVLCVPKHRLQDLQEAAKWRMYGVTPNTRVTEPAVVQNMACSNVVVWNVIEIAVEMLNLGRRDL